MSAPHIPSPGEASCQILVALFSCLGHFSFVLASALRMQMFVLQPSVVSPVCYRVNLEFQSKHLCT